MTPLEALRASNSQGNGNSAQTPLQRFRASQPPPKPTFKSKVIGFAKDIAKDAVSTLVTTPAARATEAATRVFAPNSLAAKGYEQMQSDGTPQVFKTPLIGDITVEQQKGFGQGGGKQIAGQALHSASYLLPMTPLGKSIVPTVGGAVLGSSKLTPAALRLAKYTGLATEGGIVGGGFGAGTSMEQGATPGEIAKSTLVNAGLGATLGVGIPVIGNKIFGKKIPTSKLTQTDALKLEKPPIPIPEKVQQYMDNVSGPKIGENTPLVNKGEIPQATQEMPFKAPQTQETTNVPPIKTNTPEFAQKVESDAVNLARDAGDSVTDPVVYSTYKEWSNKINSLPEDIQNDVALGGRNPFPEVPSEAFKSVVSERAYKNNDKQLIDELARNKKVRIMTSKYAQGLSAVNMSSKENPLRLIDRINIELEQKITPAMKEKINKESIDITKKVIDDVKNMKPRPEIVDNILSSLICK